MSGGIPIGRVAGFPIRVNWSVLVILWLFTWSLAATLPETVAGYSTTAYWLAGVCGALVLLASLLAHEVAHAVVARRAGVKVLDVTLWLFGGVTRLGGEAKTPRTAFWIAISGPAVSLALSVVFGGAAVVSAGAPAQLVTGVLWWLAAVNLVLGLFNLLPGSPLDGGQVLRSWLWRRHGDPVRAAVGAARAGRVLAFTLIALGLLEFLTSTTISGVWLAFIGWFIYTAARADEDQAMTTAALAGVRVADAMTADPRTAPGWITVADFIERYLLGDRHSAYPVASPDGSIVGLITLEQLRGLSPQRRSDTPISEIAVRLDHVTTAGSREPITALLERLAADGNHRALVVDDGRMVGIVTAHDLARLVDAYRLARPGATRSRASTPDPAHPPRR